MAISEGTKMAWTVVTADGDETTHTYDMPQSLAQATKVIATISNLVVNAITGRNRVLLLQNPSVAYNPGHIIRVYYDAFGQEELQTAIEDAQRGFRVR